MSEKQATIYDVAEAAGVSIATVSRVMSGGSVSAASRKKVEEAMEALSYTPSPSASHKQEKKNHQRLALVVSELTNPYFAALAAGAEKEARRNGYTLQMYTVPLRSGNARPVIDRLIEQKLEGAVLVCEEGVFHGQPPKIEPVNTVGCGDSMVAGFAVAMSRGLGAQDALRLAVAEELTPNAPLVLDDALVRFDDRRLASALKVLQESASTKQVILFTCQTREKAILADEAL